MVGRPLSVQCYGVMLQNKIAVSATRVSQEQKLCASQTFALKSELQTAQHHPYKSTDLPSMRM